MTGKVIDLFNRDGEDGAMAIIHEETTELAIVEAEKLLDPVAIIETEVTVFIDTTPKVLVITDDAQNLSASEVLKSVKNVITHAEDTRKTLVKPLNDEVSRINKKFKELVEPLAAFEATAKAAIVVFTQEQARRAKEAQAEAERIRKEREEQLKIEADEAFKKSEEEKAKAEKKRLEAETATGKERSALLRSAAADEQRAVKLESASVESSLLANAVAAAPIKAAAAPAAKISGVSQSMTYKTAVADKALFVKYCLDTGNLHYLDIPTGPLDKIVAATKGEQKFPGILVSQVPVVRIGR